MKDLDAYTIQEQEISSAQLMERAANQVAHFIFSHYSEKARPIIIFSGPGNNGGDGLAVARILSKAGYESIQAFLFNTNNTLSNDCEINAKRLQEECPQVEFTEVQQQFEAPELSQDTLIIDALFGTGLNKPLGGGYAALVKFINAAHSDVVSIDMPSGLMCEDNTYNSPSAIVRATYTLTLGLPKLSLLLPDSQPYVGQAFTLNINLSEKKISEIDSPFQIIEKWQIKRLLKKRPAFGHKGTFGTALLIAGQHGMAGAAILAAKACLKSGVGKIVVHTPILNNNILQIAVPEAILEHDEDNRIFTTPTLIESFQALAIGPGLGQDKRTALAFIEQTSHTEAPLIIDADGINILGSHKGWISQIPQQTILTPHPKEMQRLGICNSDSYSILLEAINMAQRHRFFICLKGHYTAICTPEGKVYFNPTGNSGMATAGSGDVLTGIILSLIAQGYNQEDACLLGIYLHGLAGDYAAMALGEQSVVASDLIAYLPEAFKALEAPSTDEDTNSIKAL